jgi:thymidine phosphorylase
VCPTAGVEFHCKRGSQVKRGEKIMTIWSANQNGLNSALSSLAMAVEYSEEPPPPRKLILMEIK